MIRSRLVHWYTNFTRSFSRLARAPRRWLLGTAVSAVSVSLSLIMFGAMLHQPSRLVGAAPLRPSQPDGPLIPADFTPVSSPPSAFVTATATPSPIPAPATPAKTEDLPTATPAATPSPIVPPIDTILADEAQESRLTDSNLITLLLLGTDARSGEETPSRTDTIMVAVLDLEASSATIISIPRDLWVWIPNYGEARINTAYFLGQLYGEGTEVVKQTVSDVLGLPITESAIINFELFRRAIDEIGGITIDVPYAIDDPFYPDDSYGYLHLQIPAGTQQMDGEMALRYARTRHGDSDIARAERQQAIVHAVRRQILSPSQIARLPSILTSIASEVETTLSPADLFFLARFARTLDPDRIHMHVIAPPLLWDGVTFDGQLVLLYDQYTLQAAVQEWLAEARQERTVRDP